MTFWIELLLAIRNDWSGVYWFSWFFMV